MPPALTKPSDRDERKFRRIGRVQDGRDYAMVEDLTWQASVKVNASIGAMSKCSIVSANRQPSIPMECAWKMLEPDGGEEKQRPD
jgi:hypothetical protein